MFISLGKKQISQLGKLMFMTDRTVYLSVQVLWYLKISMANLIHSKGFSPQKLEIIFLEKTH